MLFKRFILLSYIYRLGCFKNMPKKPVFRHLYKMRRPPINLLVVVSSTQDSKFVKPKSFRSIPAVSEATGISLRAVRNAYHSGRNSIRKASGEVYTLKWYSPMAPIDTSKCCYCHNALTVKDRSTWFHMERKDIKELPMTFTSLYVASKVTGISNNALRNACEKNNKAVTRRKGEFARYQLDWFYICGQCNPSPPKKSKGEVKGYVIPMWSWDKNNHLVLSGYNSLGIVTLLQIRCRKTPDSGIYLL